MAARTKPPFRADHVGSLLRPKSITDAFKKFHAGEISADEVTAAQDQAIKDVINDVSDESFIYLPSKLIQFRKYKNISRLASFFIKKYRVNFSNKILVFDKTITKKASIFHTLCLKICFIELKMSKKKRCIKKKY